MWEQWPVCTSPQSCIRCHLHKSWIVVNMQGAQALQRRGLVDLAVVAYGCLKFSRRYPHVHQPPSSVGDAFRLQVRGASGTGGAGSCSIMASHQPNRRRCERLLLQGREGALTLGAAGRIARHKEQTGSRRHHALVGCCASERSGAKHICGGSRLGVQQSQAAWRRHPTLKGSILWQIDHRCNLNISAQTADDFTTQLSASPQISQQLLVVSGFQLLLGLCEGLVDDGLNIGDHLRLHGV
mmetsp:Transcript_42553/g.99820  ORF Transcript_42553/g.99820 Transcript_42553/m.99820 type:complete len:240 (+) Transcript_42553:3353-4072(+)